MDSRYQWKWLQRSGISKEVEAFLFAAQEQAIPTNIIKNKIYGQTHISPLCRLCGQSNETVDHLTSSCSYIAQTAYKHRHDQVAKFIHWKLLAMYSIDKYRDLQIIVQQLWGVPISIVPIVIGALGSVSLDHSNWLKVLDFDYHVIPLLQKTVLLGTFNILWRYLNVVP